MGTFWNEERIKMYENACKLLNYPEVPLKEFFEEIIRPEDTVLEIGSGVGVVTLYLAEMCKRVIAVDEDVDGCENLRKRAKEKGLTNIDIVNNEWPYPQAEAGDVSITVYVSKAFNTPEKLRQLLQSTRRTGLFMIPHPSSNGDYPSFVYDELNIDLKTRPTYDDGKRTMELLEAEGIKYRYSIVPHEFGQPVKDLDEGAHFLMRMLKVKDDVFSKARQVVEKIAETRHGQLYIPYMRKNYMIIFEKDGM